MTRGSRHFWLSPQRNASLSAGSLIRSTYLLYLSQPVADRAIFKAIKGRPIRSIVELGIGKAERTARLLEVAAWQKASLPLRYTGIDEFEGRAQDRAGLSLKAAFGVLRSPSVRVQLVPGDPYSALVRSANGLAGTDLVIVSADLNRESLARAWVYLPRMLHAESLVFQQDGDPNTGKTSYRQLTLLDVQRLAAVAGRGQRQAA
jgi:hypothetical protein